LADLDLRSLGLARTDHDVRSPFETADGLAQVADRRREIGVGERQLLAIRRREADLERVSLAPVLLVSDHARADGKALGDLAGHVEGVVAAAVVDEDDFGFVGLLAEVGPDGSKGVPDPLRFVVGGNHQRHEHRILPAAASRRAVGAGGSAD